jgi:hypothetical protein
MLALAMMLIIGHPPVLAMSGDVTP